MEGISMTRIAISVFIVALASLVVELMLTRIFETLLIPNLSYVVVTAAVFGFGLAGLFVTLAGATFRDWAGKNLATISGSLGMVLVLIIPMVNNLHLDWWHITRDVSVFVKVVVSYSALYLLLLTPFVLTGILFIVIFSKYASNIHKLYFWDLFGAGLGAMLVVPLLPKFNPGSLIILAASAVFLATGLLARQNLSRNSALGASFILLLFASMCPQSYFEFDDQLEKRGVRDDVKEGNLEYINWDPISKIQILNKEWTADKARPWWKGGDKKHIAYDGGNQSSYYYPFDGNLQALRSKIDANPRAIEESFWQISVLASHYLKRDTGSSVLVIGAAGGQETKAALMYGARHVQAVELVADVVRLGKGRYASYIGDIFNRPNVNAQAGEGRSWLRQSKERFDIIQIFSTHTSSGVARGNGAVAPVYLQTKEAYRTYYEHLSDDGVLHINHHYYPRMITTAAAAWKESGRANFADHVAVFVAPRHDSLPCMLIKMTPWTNEEIRDLSRFLAPTQLDIEDQFLLAESPIDSEKRFLSPEFFSGEFTKQLAESLPLDLTPVTDDRPFFSLVRKNLRTLDANSEPFVTAGMASLVNRQLLKGWFPVDVGHLIMVGVLAVLFAVVLVFVPLKFSTVGKSLGSSAWPMLVYFSCLGAGFIIIELTYIQRFMHLIGSPLYTYSTVIFTMLLGAGIGSFMSSSLKIGPTNRWVVPFVGVLVVGIASLVFNEFLFDVGLQFGLILRLVHSGLIIFPLGFFLGMCLPLGILALERQSVGLIAWAWGMNGIFTVIGGLASMVLAVFVGLANTLLIGFMAYIVAMFAFPRMRDAGMVSGKT